MKNKQYHLVIDMINILLRFMVSYTLISFIILFVSIDSSAIVKALCLFPVPFISYIIGIRTKHIWTFIILHLLVLAAYTFTIGSILIRVVYGIYIIIITVTTFLKKIKIEETQKSNTTLLLIVIIFAMNLYCSYRKFSDLNQLFVVIVIIYVLLYLLNMYLLNFERFFQNHAAMSNVPIHQIKITNHVLILFFSSLCFFVMLLFTKFPLGELLKFLGNLLLGILRAFFSIFKGPSQEDVPEIMDEPAADMGNAFPTIEPSEPSVIWELIQKILLGMFTLAIITAIIGLIVYGLYQLYKLFYAKKYNNFRDVTEFISPFEKKQNFKKGTLRTSTAIFFGFKVKSNSEKIRKHFHKAISVNTDSIDKLSKDLTPSELSGYALRKSSESLENHIDLDKKKQLTAYYEKARYSNEECSKEEVQIVKNILK